MAPEKIGGGQRLKRWHVAGAGHDEIGLGIAVVARPFPDADAGRAVLDRLVPAQPLRRGLLAGHDHVDAVPAAQAMIRDEQQRVGVRRQIDAHDIGLLVAYVVDEARVLVAEAVMVLAPDVGGQQVVERRYGPAPSDLAAGFQPFRMLVEHRIDDVDEGFVAIEEAMPPGQQIAFEPALAGVLGEDLHHPAIRRQVVVIGKRLRVPGAVRDLEHVRKPVGSRLVGAEHPEIPLRLARLEHVAQRTRP